MELVGLLEQTKRYLSDLTGLKPVAVTRVFHDQAGWHVGIEMLELSRIPSSTDLLGDYDVLLAEDGSLVKFERRRTRLRSESFEEFAAGEAA